MEQHVLYEQITAQKTLTLLVYNVFSDTIQPSFAGDKSFMYGRSVSNQRIEAWRSQLRRGCTNWWMGHFKELRENGLYCDSNPVQVDCLRFCYMGLLRDDLNRFVLLWNNHQIRPSSLNGESPSGRPDLLYFIPAAAATENFLVSVDTEDVALCNQFLSIRNCLNINGSREFAELAQFTM